MSTIIRKKAVSQEKMNSLISCDYCGKKDAVLTQVETKWACEFCKNVLIEVNPILRTIGKGLSYAEAGLIFLHNAVLNSKVVVSAAYQVVSAKLHQVILVRDNSRRKVRLFGKEDAQLSHKYQARRITLYTNPLTAKRLYEYVKGNTGRMIYVDVDIDCLSEFNTRWYSLADESYTLSGDLIQVVKRKWKYASEDDVMKSIAYITQLQVAAGYEAEQENSKFARLRK